MAAPSKQKSTKRGPTSLDNLTAAIEAVAAELSETAIGRSKARSTRKRLEDLARVVAKTAEQLDPIRRPASSFDPSDPGHIGRFIALTLIAQDRKPLTSVERFYGAGIYAIYYIGPLGFYAPISRSEHPIYVGKADPAKDKARTVVEQGTKLWARLNEHRKSISKSKNLKLDHFECRYLVVASGWQTAAEEYLISLFRPVWNKQVKLVFGIGKHGDSADTRLNRRSPWDTLHSGRKWATSKKTENQKSSPQIRSQLKTHFSATRPYKNIQDIFRRFLIEVHQLPIVPKSGSETKK